MIDKDYLNKLREKIAELVANSDLTVDYIDERTGNFNIKNKNDNKIIHILESKFKKKNGQLLFKSLIAYKKPNGVKRIGNSPGGSKKLITQLEKYHDIKNLIENEEFLKIAKENNYLPLTGEIKEDARRLTIYAALKLYYIPKYGNKPEKFENEKFEDLNKKIKQATRADKQEPMNDDEIKINTLNYILNAINTKPFVILSGISGTGKTQIARIISACFIK